MMFDAEKEVDYIVNFVREYYQNCGLKGAVVGVSGGKDSAVVLALLSKALGSENVVGVAMPCHSTKTDTDYAKIVCDYFGVKLFSVDLTSVFDTFTSSISEGFGAICVGNTRDSDINLKPRLRMSTLYYIAAMLTRSEGKGYLVAGTSNKCELFVGYFTKGGDNVHDIALISDFTVDEVIAIGEYLGVPSIVLHRPPSDGLSGVTDEEKLGVRYSEIADYILDPNTVSDNARDKIESLHNGSRHKFSVPTYRRNE